MANKKASVDTVRTGIEEITTQGDLLYKGATDLERLPKGTSGQTLKMGSSNEPEWATVASPASPAWTVISSGTVGTSSSPVASLDITGITGNIRVIFSFESYTGVSAGWDLYARVSTDNGSSWKTGGSDYGYSYNKSNTSTLYSSTGASAMKLGATGGVFTADVVNSASSIDYTAIGCNGTFYADSGNAYNHMSAGVYKASTAVTNAVQFLDTGGSRMHGKYVALSLNV